MKKSSETSKDAVEGSAKSTAEEVRNTVQKTTDKMKISGEEEESKMEL